MSRRTLAGWGWLPLLLTALLRALWLAALPEAPTAPVDAEGFHLLAVNILEGRGFAIGWAPPFCATAVRTPLYPFFLVGAYSLLGRGPERIVRLHILLEVLTTAWIIALTRVLLAGHRGTGRKGRTGAHASAWAPLTAGLLYALNPLTPRYSVTTLSEPLLLLGIAASLTLTIRLLRRPTERRAALACLGWGLTLLAKPNVQYLVLAVVALVVIGLARGSTRFSQRRWLVGLTFCLTLTLTVLPWLLRNRLVLGRWVLSTAFEENLARVSAVAVQADVAGVRVEPWTETWEHYYDRLVDRAGGRYGWLGWHPDRRDGVSCGVYRQRKHEIALSARSVVLEHPALYLRAHLRGVVKGAFDPNHRLWYPMITGRDWATTGVVPDIGSRIAWSLARGAVGDALHAFWTERLRDIPRVAGLIWWGLVVARWLVVAAGALGVGRLADQPIPALLLILTIAYHLILPGPIAYDRFYLPALPAALPFVVLGLARIIGLQPFGHAHWATNTPE